MKSMLQNDNENDDLISEINVTPLVDVMLLLMIIFLVTAPLLVNNIDVKLPKALGASQTKSESRVIAIKENGDLMLDGVKMSFKQLESSVEHFAKKDLMVKIAADKNCRYQDVASVLSLLSQNQVSGVSFLTQN